MKKVLILVSFLLCSTSMFPEDLAPDGKLMIDSEVSISGKDLFELRFNFLHYKVGSSIEEDMVSIFDEVIKEAEYFYSSLGLPAPSFEFDFDMDIQSFGIEGVFNKNFNSFVDVGVLSGINFYQGPNISLTGNLAGDVFRLDAEFDHTQFHFSPYLRIRKEIGFRKSLRIFPVSVVGAKLFYHKTNIEASASISSGQGIPTFANANQENSQFDVYPFVDLGLELWFQKFCFYPSIGYHKDYIVGSDYQINKSIGFYYVLGIYDSVFFKYSQLSGDEYEKNEFLLGASISLF